mmetsp:Transcript_2599/g.6006  ORF Transcript_2599/g.6006 Transcript_2599/m.6006 type:complete len:80 (+) Transcript_2599:386-625(+)
MGLRRKRPQFLPPIASVKLEGATRRENMVRVECVCCIGTSIMMHSRRMTQGQIRELLPAEDEDAMRNSPSQREQSMARG